MKRGNSIKQVSVLYHNDPNMTGHESFVADGYDFQHYSDNQIYLKKNNNVINAIYVDLVANYMSINNKFGNKTFYSSIYDMRRGVDVFNFYLSLIVRHVKRFHKNDLILRKFKVPQVVIDQSNLGHDDNLLIFKIPIAYRLTDLPFFQVLPTFLNDRGYFFMTSMNPHEEFDYLFVRINVGTINYDVVTGTTLNHDTFDIVNYLKIRLWRLYHGVKRRQFFYDNYIFLNPVNYNPDVKVFSSLSDNFLKKVTTHIIEDSLSDWDPGSQVKELVIPLDYKRLIVSGMGKSIKAKKWDKAKRNKLVRDEMHNNMDVMLNMSNVLAGIPS